MRLKKFSDYNAEMGNKETEPIVNDVVDNISTKKIDETSKLEIKKTTNKEVKVNEEVLLTPTDKDLPIIEILEERIIKFNAGDITEILETIKSKYSDTDYYMRKKDNQLHVVKYNEQKKLNVNEFVNSLLKFYSTNKENNNIIKNIKVKGNQSFAIIENMNLQFSNKFVNDLTKLLANKND